jgi:hypothetical protein
MAARPKPVPAEVPHAVAIDLVAELVDDGDDELSAEEAAVHIEEAP